MTANLTATNDATAYLIAHGFRHDPGPNWYDAPDGRVRVEINSANGGWLTVYAMTGGWLSRWQVQLYGAPLVVFIATVTAAAIAPANV